MNGQISFPIVNIHDIERVMIGRLKNELDDPRTGGAVCIDHGQMEGRPPLAFPGRHTLRMSGRQHLEHGSTGTIGTGIMHGKHPTLVGQFGRTRFR
eukprot:scaffold51766_cov53-Attheya_sp.AAC.1